MDGLPIRRVGNDHLQAMPLRQPAPVNVLLHREPGAEQTHRRQAGAVDGFPDLGLIDQALVGQRLEGGAATWCRSTSKKRRSAV
jgi:hypothetical protein